MVGILLLVCGLFAGTAIGFTEDANELVERILSEGNEGLPVDTYLPDTFSELFQLEYSVRVTVRGVRVIRGCPGVFRTKDAVAGLFAPGEGILRAYLGTGPLRMHMDDVEIVTPWRTLRSKAELTYEEGEFTVTADIHRAAGCSACNPRLRAVNVIAPKLALNTETFFGKMFDFLVNRLQGTFFMQRAILRLYRPAFNKAVVEPFRNAAVHNLCNCTMIA